ncbi:MAG: DUF4422 domain-containing protein [Eubacterium sp.]|nr:DUF4422 domain-containing protein [Eubacterium sp.]
MSVRIFSITHKPFTPPADPMYIPLHVGRANAADFGFQGDDTKDNISSLNPYFCELTGMYWLWKNYHESDFIGICHYRRYLIDENGSLYTAPRLEELLTHYDMITTKLLTLTCSYYDGFGENHHLKDLITTGDVIREKYPKYAKTFDTLVHGTHTYFGNIFITSKERYDSYCSWLFDILFEVQRRTDFTGYNDYNKRLFGFLSEFLQTVWVRHNSLRVLECKVGMIGEKYETRKLREQMAAFLEKRDYEQAGQYFLACYQKRPDVLMEASDVTGELRLCMQIISTCSYEDAMYQTCILDKIRGYDSLISHFHRLNAAVSHFLADSLTKDDSMFLKQNNCITQVAIDISVKLFCKDSTKQEQISEKLWYICSRK